MKLKIAIIGGGPSAFYCASRILSKLPIAGPRGKDVEVHMFDRLWAPHGLVRYGVAPDHPEVKNCTHKFDDTAQDPRFKFFGNVNVGSVPSFPNTVQIPIDSIRRHYSHIVLAYGASLPFVLPSLGSAAIPALSIVHWYTGHPSNPATPPIDSISHMTVMGHGNVSLDIARLLLSSPQRLAPLDIPQRALDVLSSSTIKHISIASRRGPAQVAFTAKELRELLNLPDVAMIPIAPELLTTPEGASRQQSRILDLLRKGSVAKPETVKKTWSLEFFRSPAKLIDNGVEFNINALDEEERAVPTGLTEHVKTDLIVNSVGYRSEPLEPDWFNGALGRVRQSGSRVLSSQEKPVDRTYTSGWAANGAKGVLATTMMDAYNVAERILEDSLSGPQDVQVEKGVPFEVQSSTQRVINYQDWKRIDTEEIRRGQQNALISTSRTVSTSSRCHNMDHGPTITTNIPLSSPPGTYCQLKNTLTGPVPGSACAFKRAATLAANERKVFVLHDEGENATAARLRTVALAKLFDASEIVTYYKNAPNRAPSQPGDTENTLRASWTGKDQHDLVRIGNHVRQTVDRKGFFVGMISLGQSRRVLEIIAKEHNLIESKADPDIFPSSGRYPISVLTPDMFTTFYIPDPEPFSEDALAPLPALTLPNRALLQCMKDVVSSGRRLYGAPKPSMEELRAAKVAKKQALVDSAKKLEEDRKIWTDLKLRKENGEDIELPEKPLSGKQRKKRRKIEEQMMEIWGDPEDPNDDYPSTNSDEIPTPKTESSLLTFDTISNYVIDPTAEPVAPCPVNLLDEMIQWLEQDVDIVAGQEPRIDFVRGSILGKTTVGGGTSVDLCKQVVGPKGIKPILDAVAKNSHIDRFLLGNNIVGDEGAKVIADFISSEASKRVYNFYIAGNSISPDGIREIAAALATNTTVTALWLKRNPIMPQGAKYLASMLSMNTTLQTLDLVNTGVRDEGVIAVMDALKSNPSSALKHLYLGCNAESLASAIAIRDYLLTGHSKLTSLFASSSRLGDEGIIALAEGLKVDTKMERLGLESVRVGDVGAKALADALEHHPSIVFLDLGFRKGTFEMGEKANHITDEGLFYIAEKLIGPPNNRRKNTLRLLDLTSNCITKEGAEEFVNKYIQGNDQLLRIRLNQKGSERNIDVEHKLKAIGKENSLRYFDANISLTEELQERERVKEALDPKHISEIYSIYRGKINL
ncbi:hypothetical protein CPB86DRAFT_703316 [Serendipita vermifera]|nr:hypothetical protein CPB86DRAFT_703316 [Serendipita vermifera]